MKNKTLAITVLSIAAFAVGCSKEQKEQPVSQQIKTVKTETKQAAQDMKDYTYAQKDEFVKAMQVQLDALNKDLTSSPPRLTAPATRSRPRPNPNSRRCATRWPG